MSQNTSSAVMQRRTEAKDSFDDFPTPPWATRALCEHLRGWTRAYMGMANMVVAEPAANRGYMARPLAEYFGEVEASDIVDYGAGYPVRDYLGALPAPDGDMVDWTITNPPFRLAEQFIAKAIKTSRDGVAIFVRSAFLEGQERHKRLFSQTPPSDILQFTERVIIYRGKCLDPKVPVPHVEQKTGKVVVRNPASATAYCWLVWIPHREATRFHWIPPCRTRLQKPGDYDFSTGEPS